MGAAILRAKPSNRQRRDAGRKARVDYCSTSLIQAETEIESNQASLSLSAKVSMQCLYLLRLHSSSSGSS